MAGDEDTLESWIEKSRRLLKQPLRDEIEWRRIEINRGRWYEGVKNFISAMYGASEARRFTKSLPSINIHDSHYTKAQRGLAQVSAGIIFLDTLRGLPTRKDVTQTVTSSGEAGPLSPIEEVDRLFVQALVTQEATRGQSIEDNTARIVPLRRELLRAIQLYAPDGTDYYERAQAYISENRGIENLVEGISGGGIVDIRRKPLTGQLIDILHEVHSALERAERTRNTSGTRAATMSLPGSDTNREVFIVHGHDESALEWVKGFVREVGLVPRVLREQPSGGRTLMEKIAYYAPQMAYTLVLLTPDDTGYARTTGDDAEDRTHAQPRARQNVILEWGYLMGLLGRDKVCALRSETVEMPSDLHGVIYEGIDARGAWKNNVAREMRDAGLTVDTGGITTR